MAEGERYQLFEDNQLSDLIRDARLTTTVRASEVVHRVYSSTPEQPQPVLVEQSWKRVKRLGQGSFGVVWLERCTNMPLGKSKYERAVKEIAKDKVMLPVLRQFKDELEAIFKFSHERYRSWFTQSYGWWETPTAICMAMELASHGNLSDHLDNPFSELVSCGICKQLLDGLYWMHENRFAHRDLKPQNVLVFQTSPTWWVKLSDFGISKRLHDNTALRTTVGTLAYMAPEIRGIFAPSDDSSDSGEEDAYTFAVDMWSLGQLTSQMITGRLLFQDARQLHGYVARGKPFPLHDLQDHDASELCCDFIENLMSRSPSHRITAEQARNHSWIAAKGNQLTNQDSFGGIGQQIETNLTFGSVASAAYSTIAPREMEPYQEPADPLTIVLPAISQYTFRQAQYVDFEIDRVAFSLDGRQLVSATSTTDIDSKIEICSINLWEADSQGQFQRVQKLEHDGSKVDSIIFSPNGQWIVASIPVEKYISRWKAGQNSRFDFVSKNSEYGCASPIVFLPNSQQFAAAYAGDIVIHELDGQGQLDVVEYIGWVEERLSSLDISPNGQLLAYGTYHPGSAYIWKIDDQGTCQQLQKIPITNHEQNDICAIKFSCDGQRLACGDSFGCIILFELNRQGQFKRIQKLETGEEGIKSLCWMPNSEGFISDYDNCIIHVWQADIHGQFKVVAKAESWIAGLSPDGQWLATVTDSGDDGRYIFYISKWQPK